MEMQQDGQPSLNGRPDASSVNASHQDESGGKSLVLTTIARVQIHNRLSICSTVLIYMSMA